MEQKDFNNKSIKNENDISEIKGKWDALATKEFVRDAINEQTRQLTEEISGIKNSVNALNDKQSRITGAGDLIKLALPTIISIATLVTLILSLILSK